MAARPARAPGVRPSRSRVERGLKRVLVDVQLTAVAALFLGPIAWMFWASFQNNAVIISSPPRWDAAPTMLNYAKVLVAYPFLRYGLNSVIIAGGATALGLILGVPAAWAAARYRLRWPAFLMLLARMAPGVLFLIPWYLLASAWHLTGNYLVLIAVHAVITMPVIVWLMISFFDEVPTELEESARIDGCGTLQVLGRISIPLALPGVAVSTILAFIFAWNYFLFALVLAGYRTTPLTVAAFGFIGESSVDWAGLMAAATVISLPPMVLVLLVQRWLVRGLTLGSVKG
jgi:multiple sugar transport system permease protein